jgi:hypothetical protein
VQARAAREDTNRNSRGERDEPLVEIDLVVVTLALSEKPGLSLAYETSALTFASSSPGRTGATSPFAKKG